MKRAIALTCSILWAFCAGVIGVAVVTTEIDSARYIGAGVVGAYVVCSAYFFRESAPSK